MEDVSKSFASAIQSKLVDYRYEYQLMNKNELIATFMVEKEGGVERAFYLDIYRTPSWCKNITAWIRNRSIAKHSNHLNKLLKEYSANTIIGFIELTHCLSVNDTLWVKKAEENISWGSVNLYNNEFSEVCSKTLFDTFGVVPGKLSTTLPTLTSDGSYPKCWVRDDNGIVLIKAGSSGARNAGLEPYSEYLASQIFDKLNAGISYRLERYHGNIVSVCNLFTNEKYGYRPMSAINANLTDIDSILDCYSNYGDEDKFRRLLVCDCITLNCDRHLGNFGFLVDNDTFELTGISPGFDYNLSFVPYAEFDRRDGLSDFDDFSEYLAERGPRLGDDYIYPARQVLTSQLRSELINLKDLELVCPSDDKFTDGRLKLMNKIKNIQIDNILGRTVTYNLGTF